MKQQYPIHILGVDFSGAVNAGRKIWIATSRLQSDGALNVENVRRIADFEGSPHKLSTALTTLREHLAALGEAYIGLDFPFGVPRTATHHTTWGDFVRAFAVDYPTAADFPVRCTAQAGGEVRRVTDEQTKTPFVAYNLRMYKQTYYGIREILAPLVSSGKVRVLPMQQAEDSKPALLEVCPASWLKYHKIYFPYKGKTPAHYEARQRLMRELHAHGVQLNSVIQGQLLIDAEGDALDSVIAALVAARALDNLYPTNLDYTLEGFVYS